MKHKRIRLLRKRKVYAKICPRCGGAGTFLSGETCYYCQGAGSV